MDLSRNKILITGAKGFVGSRLSNVLEEMYPNQVLLMAHSELPAHKTDAWFQADLLDPDSYEEVLPTVKTVIHLAQLNDAFTQSSDRFFEHQQKLTENLIHSCIAFGVEEFIFLSSLSTTLRTPDPRVFSDEGSQSPWLPTAFAKSKYKEELLIKKAEAEGLKVLIFYVAPLVEKTGK
ncbi:MAG: NAD(P)-dependent oxidoreductase [Saprospiraceae bacterium]|nr:NAD(P)-dependent oxidoreductase [Saprospiraceae bacterium]